MTSPNQEMKAQILEGFNQPYKLATYPVPKITSENDILIKVDATGYCHTDAVLAAGQRRGDPKQFPHIGGHEFAGTVIGLPENPSSETREYPVGTRVGVPGRGVGSCGSCFECKSPANDRPGYSYYCQKGGSNGLSKHGGFAEYAVVDARQCMPLPENMEAVDAAPLMCAGVTIFNVIKRCNLSTGQRIGIIGCGGGLWAYRSLNTKARIVDARTLSADDLAKEMGEEDGKTDRFDMGLDAVLILPDSQPSFDYGMTLLRNHSLCIVVSIPERPFQLNAWDLVFRDITVRGTILGTNPVLRETVEFAAKHGVKAVKKLFTLENLNDLVDEYHRGFGGKLVLDMSSK